MFKLSAGHSDTLIENIFYLFSILNHKGSIMGRYYSDHIAGYHIHTDRLGMVSTRLQVLLDQKSRPWLLQWFETFGPHAGFLTYQ